MISNCIYIREVVSIVGCCKDSSPGFDDIRISPLHCVFQYTADSLSNTCDISLTHGVIPETLKIVNVISLLKTMTKCIITTTFQYRCFALSQKYLKMWCIRDYLTWIQEKHSGQLALAVLMDKIMKSIVWWSYLWGFLYFPKAFDTVEYLILLCKLQLYEIRRPVWIGLGDICKTISHLSHELFITRNHAATPRCSHGSIVNPFLLLIYINDLASICHHTMPIFLLIILIY